MKNFNIKVNGNNYRIDIDSVHGNQATVTVNGTSYHVEFENTSEQPASVSKVSSVVSAPAPQVSVPKVQSHDSNKEKAVKAPLPGVIVAVNVNVGDVVKVGQTVAVLEAMKMENELESEYSGTVTAIHVAKNDSVLEGATIITLA